MPPYRIGVQLHPQHTTYAAFADAVKRVEALGVDTIWNWDHFFPLSGPAGDDRHFEGWTLLTAMATLTTRAEIGCLVTCNSYRSPALLTHMAKTVDHISNGRLILGIGSGWFQRDYDAKGYEFGTAAGRLLALGESLQIIKEQMALESPAPIRNPIPILIGGAGEKITLRLVAQYADLWNAFGTPDEWKHKSAVLDNWCREIGRDPAEIERTVGIDPDDIPGTLDAYAEVGVTQFILGMGADGDFDKVEQLVRWRDNAN